MAFRNKSYAGENPAINNWSIVSPSQRISRASMKTLNKVYSPLSARRRYEVWFVRLGLADGSGAWWFRYLLLNPGRAGCEASPGTNPVQFWAAWFPRGGGAQSFIQGFAWED